MVTFKSLKDSRVFQVNKIPYSISVGDKVYLTLRDHRNGKWKDPEIYILDGIVESIEHKVWRIITSDLDTDSMHYSEYDLIVNVKEN